MSRRCTLRFSMAAALLLNFFPLSAATARRKTLEFVKKDEVATSRYSSAKYGISLEYPKSYQVREGDIGGVYSLGYLGPIPMEFSGPGGIRVVTVIATNDSYPGTDFETAFVTVSINDRLTRQDCERFPDLSGMNAGRSQMKISGVEFQGLSQGEGGLGHQFGGNYYHGFVYGRCYEFGLGLATSGLGAIEGIKPVDRDRIFSVLERIVEDAVISKPHAPGL